MRKKLGATLHLAGLLLLGASVARAQNTTTIPTNGAPTGGCAPMIFYEDQTTGTLYICKNGIPTAISSGSVSASGLTTNYVPIATGAQTLGNSDLSEVAGVFTFNNSGGVTIGVGQPFQINAGTTQGSELCNSGMTYGFENVTSIGLRVCQNNVAYTLGTGSGGGTVTSITVSAPLASTQNPITTIATLSITGVAGQVLAGATPAFTGTPTLGVQNSTVGSVTVAGGIATPGSIVLNAGGLSPPSTTLSDAATTGFTIAPTARTSGANPFFTIAAPADTGITTATESIGMNYVGSTRTWVDGTVAVQRSVLFQPPTYAGTTSSATWTQAATVAISGAPIAGTHGHITNPYALWIQAGLAEFDGNVNTSGAYLLGTYNGLSFPDSNADTTSIAAGRGALAGQTTATGSNTAVGYVALNADLTGIDDTAAGAGACTLTTGSADTCIGYNALSANTSGIDNTAVGDAAGATNQTGANNVYVGYQADATGNAYSNSFAIGYGAAVNASNIGVLGNANVTDIYAGSTSGAAALHASRFVSGAAGPTEIDFTAGAAPGTTASIIKWHGPAGAITAYNRAAMPATAPTVPSVIVYPTSDVDPTWKVFPQTFTAVFDGGGSPIATATTYITAQQGCTISSTDSMWDTGNAVITTWDLATGNTALPTATQTISNAGITISSGHSLHTDASDFTAGTGTAVTALDKLGIHIVPDGTMTWAQFEIRCN